MWELVSRSAAMGKGRRKANPALPSRFPLLGLDLHSSNKQEALPELEGGRKGAEHHNEVGTPCPREKAPAWSSRYLRLGLLVPSPMGYMEQDEVNVLIPVEKGSSTPSLLLQDAGRSQLLLCQPHMGQPLASAWRPTSP